MIPEKLWVRRFEGNRLDIMEVLKEEGDMFRCRRWTGAYTQTGEYRFGPEKPAAEFGIAKIHFSTGGNKPKWSQVNPFDPMPFEDAMDLWHEQAQARVAAYKARKATS